MAQYTNTSDTYLFYEASPGSGTFTKLVDIVNYPDLLVAPPKLDATTLTNKNHVYIPDIADTADMQFNVWYDEDDYDKIKLLEGINRGYQVRFGLLGELGAWEWEGNIFINPTGAGVGAVRSAMITCYPATDIEKVTIV